MNVEEGFIRGEKISKETWRKFLVDKRFVAVFSFQAICEVLTHNQGSYTVAYVDFFDEDINKRNGDWKSVLNEYLYADAEPIINGYTGGRALIPCRS